MLEARCVRAWLVFLLLFPTSGSSTFLAKSSVETCIDDGSARDLKCKQKLIVTLALRSGQEGSETFRTEVKHARLEETSSDAQIAGAMNIAVSKTKVNIYYPLRYIQSVNNRPHETMKGKVHTKMGLFGWGSWYDRCIDAPGRDSVTCQYAYNQTTGQKIRDSQGFCCICPFVDQFPSWRGDEVKVQCSGFLGQESIWYRSRTRIRASAHCLRFSKLWYHAYELLPPVMNFTITLQLEYAEKGGRKQRQEVVVSPSVPVASSEDAKVRAEFLGDLLPPEQYVDLQHKYLLVPNRRGNLTAREGFDLGLTPLEINQVNYGQKYWLLVDRRMVDFSGRTCDTVGVSYTGFRYQPRRCHQRPDACLKNQPRDLWLKDVTLERRYGGRRRGLYLAKHYGTLQETPPLDTGGDGGDTNVTFLSYLLEDRRQSIVTMQIVADDLILIKNRSPGILLSVLTHNFRSQSRDGLMYVQVQNSGYITAEYTLTVDNCSEGIRPVQAQSITLLGQQSRILTFRLFQALTVYQLNYCIVKLFDQSFAEIDSKVAYFSTGADCECLGRSSKCGTCECAGEDGKKYTLDVIDVATNLTIDIAVGICGLSDDWLPDYSNFTKAAEERELTLREQFLVYLRSPYGILVLTVLSLLIVGALKLSIEGHCIKYDLDSTIVNTFFYKGPSTRFRPRQDVYCPHHDRPGDVRQIVAFTFFLYFPVLVILGLVLSMIRALVSLRTGAERKKLSAQLARLSTELSSVSPARATTAGAVNEESRHPAPPSLNLDTKQERRQLDSESSTSPPPRPPLPPPVARGGSRERSSSTQDDDGIPRCEFSIGSSRSSADDNTRWSDGDSADLWPHNMLLYSVFELDVPAVHVRANAPLRSQTASVSSVPKQASGELRYGWNAFHSHSLRCATRGNLGHHLHTVDKSLLGHTAHPSLQLHSAVNDGADAESRNLRQRSTHHASVDSTCASQGEDTS